MPESAEEKAAKKLVRGQIKRTQMCKGNHILPEVSNLLNTNKPLYKELFTRSAGVIEEITDRGIFLKVIHDT